MCVLTRILIRSLIGVLTVGLLGCGCLFPSTLFTPGSPNPYPDVYKAEDLRYSGKYKIAIAKYEQAFKKFPHFPDGTKVINISFLTFLKYHIAFCYTKLAEAEGDISLYVKAEAAAKQSYQTAMLPSDQADALYLWGYILYKQERYAEARAKFKKLLETLRQNEFGTEFTVDALFGLGKALIGIGDTPAAQRVFAQLLELIKAKNDSYDFYALQVLYGLGKLYLEIGDKVTAQHVFIQVIEYIEIELQRDSIGFDAEIFYEDTLYELGKVYLKLGDKVAARQAFVQLEARVEVNLQEGHSSAEDNLYELGKAYLELGDEFAARRVFAQLRVHFPKSSYKAEVERLLEKQ